MRLTWVEDEMLILVKTYPNPSARYIETTCTGAVTRQGEWLRLYPIPFRYLRDEQRFRKYQWIRARIQRRTRDHRPESHQIDSDSITITDTDEYIPPTQDWALRKAVLYPLRDPSLEYLKEQQRETNRSLGFIRVQEVDRFEIVRDDMPWTPKELRNLQAGQRRLFDESVPKDILEKIPYEFYYHFHCEGQTCTGHKMRVFDWEIAQLYRNCRANHKQEWEKPFRNRMEKDLADNSDLHFFVGTVARHPQSWTIVGVFYPPKRPYEQLALHL